MSGRAGPQRHGKYIAVDRWHILVLGRVSTFYTLDLAGKRPTPFVLIQLPAASGPPASQ